MKRPDFVELMKRHAARMAELGQVVDVVLKAEEHTIEDLQAVLTAANIAKTLADEVKAAKADFQGKEQRAAVEIEKALRMWSFGTRLLCDALGGKSPALMKESTAAIEQGSKAVAEAINQLP